MEQVSIGNNEKRRKMIMPFKLLKRTKFVIWIFMILTSLSFSFAQDIVINEFLASNASINQDPDFQDYSDWIEIYNTTEAAINLDGYYLTDNLEDTTKWQIPSNTTIESRGFLLFWADGRDQTLSAYHTNYKLQKAGEEIGLFSPDGVLIDHFIYDAQTTDISFGRQPDCNPNWYPFTFPTPNSTNNSSIFLRASPPKLSLPEGFYTTEQSLEMSGSASTAVIRFTLNGDEPTETSPIYTAPLTIKSKRGHLNVFSEIQTTRDPHFWLPQWVPPKGEVFKATVVRARAFETGKLPSPIVTKTYFVDPNIKERYGTIAVISLVSDYEHLFDSATGIYIPGNTHRRGDSESGNYFQGWEKPAHISFFEVGGELAFSQDVGIQIQGGTSPASPQKAFDVIARSEYGKNRIEHPIFMNNRSKAKHLTEFKRFIIRAWGSVILSTMFNDALGHRIFAETDLDIQAYRPAVVFINGEYWGLHEIREANKNSWYYQFHYGIDRDEPGFDILHHQGSADSPYAYIDEGDDAHWNAMVQFINTHDMSLSENYEYIKTQMDVDNFILYLGHCIYSGKWDWPNNNDASWRPRTPDGRWKWIQYDMETSFGIATALGPEFASLGPYLNSVKAAVDGMIILGFEQFGPHPLLPKLLQNDEFKNQFIQWFEDHLNSNLLPDTFHTILDEMVAELDPYMEEHRHRWPFVTEMNNDWTYNLDLVRDYFNKRPDYVRRHLAEQFYGGTKTQPEDFKVHQNYPNPFNPETTIPFYLTHLAKVSMKIYDVQGKLIRTLKKGKAYGSGSHTVSWDGTNERGNRVGSGTYIFRMTAGRFYKTKKMIFLE